MLFGSPIVKISVMIILFIIFANENMLFSQVANEKYSISIIRDNRYVESKVKAQNSPTILNGTSNRGFVADFVSAQASKLSQSIWDNYKQKFTPNFSFAVKNESFYNQISNLGQFDPTGLDFKGFMVYRMVKNKENFFDTVFAARFVLDTSEANISNIYNNGFFVLKLDSVFVKTTKMKISKKSKFINFDFEIIITSSYIDENTNINSEAEIGKFLVSAVNVPLSNKDAIANTLNIKAQYSTNCIGQCFLIPRSPGFYKNTSTGLLEKCFGNGLFSIQVSVRESAKNSLLNNLLFSY